MVGEKDTMYYGIGEVVGHKIVSLGRAGERDLRNKVLNEKN